MDTNRLWVIRLVKKKDFTKEIISKHVDHLRQLDDDGRLVLAGPLEGEPAGGLVVVRASSEREARDIAEADPFVARGFDAYELRSMKQAHRKNNYLLS